ncbi:Stress response protein SCP2 [Acetitomaculum ruminis DSM 5522]|uniref:Stress response protein SCP2 n=1 Tax=Acetitomaculum ruminis DSM 5522 TaxID=1120918 RepID=A0A1I0YBP8_9FIRM|nr:TerD family protein [Acetitomaculum ruminis]SFB10789.1 Stress response protein SCP2 [Acetitomaculum ruminis DSM 5522]
MAISLQKGQKISLSKEAAGLDQVLVGLGWDEVEKKFSLFRKQADIDCDASAFLLKNNQLKGTDDVVYFGNLKHFSGAVSHMGDNLTGAGEGDDEQLVVELQKLPNEYNKVIFVVNIYKAYQRKQSFGNVKNCFIHLIDQRNNQEICRYDISGNYDDCTAMIVGELEKTGNEWHFNAIGEGTQDGSLDELTRRYR